MGAELSHAGFVSSTSQQIGTLWEKPVDSAFLSRGANRGLFPRLDMKTPRPAAVVKAVPAAKAPESVGEYTMKKDRKISKPIMEKKRRARINSSLDQLKSLLVEVLQKEGCRHSSKMEKADILEMTVKHLRCLQTKNTKSLDRVDAYHASKYYSGYCECLSQVSHYLLANYPKHSALRIQLLNHINNMSVKMLQTSSLPVHNFVTGNALSLPPIASSNIGLDESDQLGSTNSVLMSPVFGSSLTESNAKLTVSIPDHHYRQPLGSCDSGGSVSSASYTLEPSESSSFSVYQPSADKGITLCHSSSNQPVHRSMWRPWAK